MAALDFPASPTNGQVFVGGNGVTYTWNGTIWLASSMASQASDTPPANPTANQLWFNSSLGQLFIYYNDGNSSQWVPANPTPSGVPVGGGIIREVTLSSAAASIDLFSLGVKSVDVIFDLRSVASGNVTVGLALGSTVNTSAAYTLIRHYGYGTSAGADATGSTPSWTWFGGANGIITGRVLFPNLSAGTGVMQAWANSTVNVTVMNAALQGPSGGPFDGLRFSHAGNFAAGSVLRVIGWQ